MGAWTRYPEVGNVALNPGNIVADQFHGAVVAATAKHAAAPSKSRLAAKSRKVDSSGD